LREREKRDDESLFDDDVCGRGENDDDVFYQSRREKRLFVSKKTWSSKRGGKSSGKKW